MRGYNAYILLGCLWFLLAGCAQAMDLKGLSDNRAGTQKYIRAQEQGFLKLKDDISRGRLKKGASKEAIIASYAPPIFCKEAGGESGSRQVCLYRLPLEYFDTDTAYLFFDKNKRLTHWQLRGPSFKEQADNG